MKKLFITMLAVLACVTPASYLVADSPASAAELSSGSALRKALPATVTVVISKDVTAPPIIIDNITIYSVDSVAEENVGAGSGVIVSHDGYVITNKHVVLDTTAHYTVVLTDGTEKLARVVYRDPTLDIALLKIDGNYPSIATLGSSKNLKLGEPVLAIGNAFGQLQNAVSSGTISAFNKNITAGGAGIIEKLSGLLESSTDIVPGYSGGPLIDADGNVVGINVAKDNRESGASFSIPIDEVKTALKNYPIL